MIEPPRPPTPEEIERANQIGKRVLLVFAALLTLLLYWLAPGFTAFILFTLAVVTFVWMVVGAVRPSWAHIPNRLASVWLLTFSIGLFFAGGAALDRSERIDRRADAEAAAEAAAAEAAPERPVMTDEERLAAAQRVANENARRRRESRGQAAATTSSGGGATALQRLLDADGMNQCRLNLEARQRVLYGGGSLTRWTETSLEGRFPRKEGVPPVVESRRRQQHITLPSAARQGRHPRHRGGPSASTYAHTR